MQKTTAKIIAICLVVLLSACADPKTLERMGLITIVGYDVADDGEILTTMVLLHIDPEAPENSAILTAKAPTSKGARTKADRKSPKKLQSGQLRVALFSEEVVHLGLINLADTLARDPSISDLTYLAVVEGNTNKLLNQKITAFADVSQLIYKELDQNIKGETIPSSTLQEVMHDYYSAGVDPTMPLLKGGDGEIEITGLALIKEDRMVGKVTPTEAFYLKLINDRFRAGTLELMVNKEGFKLIKATKEADELAVVMDTIHSKTDINLLNKDKLEFEMKIKLQTRLLEINQSVDIKDPNSLKLMQKKLSDKVKADIEKLIVKAQEVGSDPFGFGEIYRKSVRHSNLTTKKWHDMYPDATVKVNVEFEIMRTGVVE